MTPILQSYEDVCDYVRQGLQSFENDAADSDFQRGFKAAYEELANQLGLETGRKLS
jgi:hypothetical protein